MIGWVDCMWVGKWVSGWVGGYVHATYLCRKRERGRGMPGIVTLTLTNVQAYTTTSRNYNLKHYDEDSKHTRQLGQSCLTSEPSTVNTCTCVAMCHVTMITSIICWSANSKHLSTLRYQAYQVSPSCFMSDPPLGTAV